MTSFESVQMISHDESSCHHCSPCRALVWNALWLLCQPSPRLTIAIGKLLTLWSELRNVRVPQTWQTELMLHVTCCIKKIRTSPPQIAPDAKPVQVPYHRPSATPGKRMPIASQRK